MARSIAIIPARGGSKRIPGKNIRDFVGVPALVRSIKLAQKSELFDRVIVSTDRDDIAQLAINNGAVINEIRPEELSNDFATTLDVMSYESSLVGEENCEYICCLYPVTPLLRVHRILEAFNQITSNAADYVYPVLELPVPLDRCIIQNDDKLQTVKKEAEFARTQDLKKIYYDAGQFYFGRINAWINKRPILTGNSTILNLDKWEVVDIDTLDDWSLAEKLFKINQEISEEIHP